MSGVRILPGALNTKENNMYYYKHTNGKIIQKPDVVVDSMPGGPLVYFDSPFVLEWWYENMGN